MLDSEKTRIIVKENQMFLEVWLEDAQFRSLAHSSNGNLEVEVVPGLYALKARLGNEVGKRLVSVEGGEGEMRLSAPRVGWKGNMPLNDANTEFFDKRIPQIKELVALKPKVLGQGSSFFFFATGKGENAEVLKGLRLENDRGEILFTFTFLDFPQVITERKQFYAGIHLAVNPGAYRLVVEEVIGCQSMMIYAFAGWQTRIFADNCELGIDLKELSITMDRPEHGYHPDRPDLRTTALALEALRQPMVRQMPEPDQEQILLWEKFQNPMLGIYWLHLAMRSACANTALMAEVLGNMQRLVPDHPDLLAVWYWFRHQFPIESLPVQSAFYNSPKSLANPPMLRSSYQAWMEASWEGNVQIPTETLMEQMGPLILNVGPWLIWNPLPLMRKESDAGEDPQAILSTSKWKLDGLVKRERAKKQLEIDPVENPRSLTPKPNEEASSVELDDAVDSLLAEMPLVPNLPIEGPHTGASRLVPLLVAELVVPEVFDGRGNWRNRLSMEGRQALGMLISEGLGILFSTTYSARNMNRRAANQATYQLTEIPKSFQFELLGRAYLGEERHLHQWFTQFGFTETELDQLMSQIQSQLYRNYQLVELAKLLKMPLGLLTNGLLDALQEISIARQDGNL